MRQGKADGEQAGVDTAPPGSATSNTSPTVAPAWGCVRTPRLRRSAGAALQSPENETVHTVQITRRLSGEESDSELGIPSGTELPRRARTRDAKRS